MSKLLPIHRTTLTAWFDVNRLENALKKQPTRLDTYPNLYQPEQSARAFNQMMHHPSQDYTPNQQQLILAGEAIAHGYKTSLPRIGQSLVTQLASSTSDQETITWTPKEEFSPLYASSIVDDLIRNCFIHPLNTNNNYHYLYELWNDLHWDCRPILLMIVSQLLTNGSVELTLPTDPENKKLLASYRELNRWRNRAFPIQDDNDLD